MQCAGTARGMTVEMREPGRRGAHLVIGRRARAGHAATAPTPDVAISWKENMTWVYSHEVFDADEATRLFVSYYQTGDVPPGYAKRPLDL